MSPCLYMLRSINQISYYKGRVKKEKPCHLSKTVTSVMTTQYILYKLNHHELTGLSLNFKTSISLILGNISQPFLKMQKLIQEMYINLQNFSS